MTCLLLIGAVLAIDTAFLLVCYLINPKHGGKKYSLSEYFKEAAPPFYFVTVLYAVVCCLLR